MCVPLIPLALMAAGTLSSYIGAKQAEHAKLAAYNNERDRQKGFEGEQAERFKDSLAKAGDVTSDEAIAAAKNKRESTLSAAIAPAATSANYLPGSSSAPAVVADAKGQAATTSRATSQNLASTLAALGGTGDQIQNLNIGLNRNSDQINQIGGFARGSMGVLDSEMQAAAAKGGLLRGLGSLATTIGGAWMGAGMAGGGSGGISAGTSKMAGKAMAFNPAIF